MEMKRKLDELGRIVLPAEVRQQLGLQENDELTITIEKGYIAVKKALPCCIFCRDTEYLAQYMDHHVCDRCRGNLT